MKDLQKYWVIILLSLLGIGLLIFIYYKGKSSGKSPHTKKVPKQATGDLTKERQEYIKALAENLYNDMNGLNVFGHDTKLYTAVSILNDPELIALSNVYNIYYEKDTGESFRQWISKETFSATNQGMVNSIINRLNKAGIV